MRAVLVGYGKFGKAVEEVLLSRKHTITNILGSKNFEQFENISTSSYDIILDCSPGEAFANNYHRYLSAGMPVVVGSTGWSEIKNVVEGQFKERNINCVFGSNFSVGIGLLVKILEENCELFKKAGFELAILDIHHKLKRDAPSGTAKLIKDVVNESYPEVPIASLRFGSVFGDHAIFLESEFDQLELKHSAKNRLGFALGMVLSAEFLLKNPGVYEFRQIFTRVLELI